MIVVDTNVISELVKEQSVPAVVAWMHSRPAVLLYTTAITGAEMLFGLTATLEGRTQATLMHAVEIMFSALFIGRGLPFDPTAAIARARAATTIATRNTRDFEGCGVALVNPWER